MLTEAFDWRAIFAVQAPVAAAALAAALHPRARWAPPDAGLSSRGLPIAAGVGLVLAFAALVGALFLAVLLVVTVWDYGPLAGAGIVSALPLAALAARPLSRRLTGSLDVAGGALLLAAGLTALALLPSTNPVYAILALAISGAGLGLALPPLTRASLGSEAEVARNGVFSVGARHLGLVVGLVAVAPLLAVALDEGSERATQNATAVILDAPLPLTQKLPIALDLYREFQAAPDGEIPDLTAPFEERADEPEVQQVGESLLETVEAALDAELPLVFRALGALRSTRGCDRAGASPEEAGGMSRRVQGLVALAALGVAALTLIVVELAQGARDYGEVAVDDPCTATVSVSGEGLDATAQQIVLDGLNGAACELGTTREELVLSFEPELGADIPWDRETIERAVRSGLLNSVDEAEDRGSIGGLLGDAAARADRARPARPPDRGRRRARRPAQAGWSAPLIFSITPLSAASTSSPAALATESATATTSSL